MLTQSRLFRWFVAGSLLLIGGSRFLRVGLPLYLTVDDLKKGIVRPVEGEDLSLAGSVLKRYQLGAVYLGRLIKLAL